MSRRLFRPKRRAEFPWPSVTGACTTIWQRQVTWVRSCIETIRIYKLTAEQDETEHAVPQLIFGPLCTSIDLLGNQVPLPPLKPGDYLGLACSGAYGLTSSPHDFISHPKPAEIVFDMPKQSTA